MTEAHHKFGPSALKYIEICPGWRNSDETNPVAEEGTLLHEACETRKTDHLSQEQKGLVENCLAYVDRLEEGADEIHKEIRLTISLDERKNRNTAKAPKLGEGRDCA